jgi:hypothetical protein
MILIERLIEQLKKAPAGSKVFAYEGEDTGFTVRAPEPSRDYSFIHACDDDSCARCDSSELEK